MKHIIVTGGTGYIGSHTCIVLMAAGFDVTIVDNLCNSRREVLDCIDRISGVRPRFVEGDIRDTALLDGLFAQQPVDAVIHFAGLKAVGESVTKPLDYYDNNVRSTLELLAAMCRAGINTLVFSSSATV
jgi:UDP-glucose 4-epimerase